MPNCSLAHVSSELNNLGHVFLQRPERRVPRNSVPRVAMIGFPIDELLSEEECYEYLKRSLHPEGLSCPNGHELPSDQAPHDRRRAPIVDYRCRECGAVFNIFTGTVWSKTHYDCSTIVMLLRGFAKGMPTKWLTDEMDLAYPSVLKRRHRIQEAVQEGERVGLPGRVPDDGLPDPEVEADEMYQNAGEKRRSAPESR